jgi:hypothetical protein
MQWCKPIGSAIFAASEKKPAIENTLQSKIKHAAASPAIFPIVSLLKFVYIFYFHFLFSKA